MDQPRYKYVLTAANGTIPQGAGEVLKPNSRTYADPLNGGRTASIVVPPDHPRLTWLYNNDALLKVYRKNRTQLAVGNNNWDLLMVGDVLSVEEKGTGGISQVTITAADPFWRLGKRLIGMSVTGGQATGFSVGTPSVPVDLSVALEQVVQAVNSDFFSGVNIGTVANCGTTSVIGPVYAAFAGPTMQDICATLGGPDFWIQPQEPSGSMPSTILGQINIQLGRGSSRPNAIFEYGMGKHNVDSYDRLVTKQNSCNHCVALPQGWPTSINAGDSVAVNDDTGSQNLRSRLDDVASSDVASIQLRNLLVQEEVAVRAGLQQQITFQPSDNNPVDFMADYGTGDTVTARAYDAQSRTFRFNGSVRIYGVSIVADDQDNETITLTLIPGG